MVFSHTTGLYNVRASLFAWLNEQITANRPPLVSTVVVTPGYEERELTPPQWSLHLLGDIPGQGYTGAVVDGGLHGRRRIGICEIDCWVSRENNPGWQGQLMQMQDVVSKVLQGISSLPIKDFYTDAAAPTNTTYRLFIDRFEVRNAPIDPNPDIERKRILVYFHWVERV